MENKLLTVSEAAKIAGVTNVTIHRWVKEGKLKAEYVRKGLSQHIRINDIHLRAVLRIAELRKPTNGTNETTE